jgi:hypothetical protein
MPFFASPQVQKTTGTRGKTTGRKSTKTVRGNDGAYVAQMKEELLAREPWTAFQASITVTYSSGIVNKCSLFRCCTREEAEKRLAEYQAHPFTRHQDDADRKFTYSITEVKVRWVMKGSEAKEEVME